MDTGKTGPLSANIAVDYAQGIHEALQHLFSLNHRRIAFIAGPLHLQSARMRHDAFVSGLKTRGIVPEHGDDRARGTTASREERWP